MWHAAWLGLVAYILTTLIHIIKIIAYCDMGKGFGKEN